MPDRIEDVLPDHEFAEFLHTIRNEVRQSSPCFCIGGGRVLNDHAAILLSRRGRNEAADDDIVAAIILAEIVLVAVILDRRDDEMAHAQVSASRPESCSQQVRPSDRFPGTNGQSLVDAYRSQSCW